MYPEDLWSWLDETSAATGADFTAIPHNSNISKGYMFPAKTRLRGTPIDEAWVKLRAKWESVVEVTQIKGDSETHPVVSPDDPFADFETYPHYIQQDPPEYDPKPGDYVRRQLYATFQDDPVAPQTYELFGEDSYMWASDFPHSDSTFPDSQEWIAKNFARVPDDVRRKITYDNAVSVYRMDLE